MNCISLKSMLLCCALACCLLGTSYATAPDRLRGQTPAGSESSSARRHLHQVSCGAQACNVPPNTSGTSCVAATCDYSQLKCLEGYASCYNIITETGCPINLKTDPYNCGSCRSHCFVNNGLAQCVNGQCTKPVTQCLRGYAACGTKQEDGCPISLMADADNCGQCGNKCFAPPNAAAQCNSGFCSQSYQCRPGRGDCDNNMGNGCEVNILEDVKNCGRCGRSCYQPDRPSACVNGNCVFGGRP